ncbi:Predicted arabinose efflux permease, MFS family [Tranquillimonas rosea]|uniref:Predicted arabinose efflux permease, MFS family n=1 Tax=Tranquillimonas rosea TaxID=641238 RepID=A0A1H9PZG8_9RHOB|nr:MFS transporter [Tranquillimonas rosea]SER53550.1 Predicted arabinose efflux permease, MFS family [Tranquillimonas rosea]
MPDLRTPWRGVAAAFALNGVLLGTWASRIPAVIERHGITEAGLGVLLLIMGIGALISFPLAGRLADGHGAAPVTRQIARVYLVSIVLVALAPGVVWLAAGLFLFGMCHGSMDVAMNSWATEVEKRAGRSIMSSFHAMWSLGAGAGAGLGFVVASAGMGYPLQFALSALVAALGLLPFLSVTWHSETRQRESTDPVFAFPRGALVLVGLVALSAGIGEGAMVDWSAVFLRDVVGTGEAKATLGYAVFSATMVGMRLIVDRLVTHHGPGRIARVSGIVAASGIFLAVTFATLPAALAGFVLMGIGYAALIPLAFSRAAADPVIPPGQGIAAVATLGYGALLLGPPAIGAISAISSLRVAFLIVGGFALVIAALAPVLSRRPAPATPSGQAL